MTDNPTFQTQVHHEFKTGREPKRFKSPPDRGGLYWTLGLDGVSAVIAEWNHPAQAWYLPGIEDGHPADQLTVASDRLVPPDGVIYDR